MLDLELLEKYSPDGSVYRGIAQDYGEAAADRVLAAFKDGGRQGANDTLVEIKNGPRLSESTLANFGRQVTTDPFSAPLATANRAIQTITSSAVFGLFKNPFVLGALILFVFIQFPGLFGRIRQAFK